MESLRAAARAGKESGPGDAGLRKATDDANRDFFAAMDDDMNTREAIAGMFALVAAANRALDAGVGRGAAEHALSALGTFDAILAFLPRGGGDTDRLLTGLLDFIVQLREDARKRKDFAVSDAIRTNLSAIGVVLEDTKDGVRWKRR